MAWVRVGRPAYGCGALRRALSLRPFDPTIRRNWIALCFPGPSSRPSSQ